jgi:hypothetical protein
MAYGLSVVFAALYLLAVAVASWFVFYVAVGYENISPYEAQKNDWLRYVAIAMVVGAIAFFLGVLVGYVWFALPGLVVSGFAGIIAVRYAIADASVHSDGLLVAFTVGCAVAGGFAVVCSAAATAARDGSRSGTS